MIKHVCRRALRKPSTPGTALEAPHRTQAGRLRHRYNPFAADLQRGAHSAGHPYEDILYEVRFRAEKSKRPAFLVAGPVVLQALDRGC